MTIILTRKLDNGGEYFQELPFSRMKRIRNTIDIIVNLHHTYRITLATENEAIQVADYILEKGRIKYDEIKAFTDKLENPEIEQIKS